MNKIYFLFESTRAVIKAEASIREAGLSCQVHPVPREVSSECGMSVVVATSEAEQVRPLLSELKIRYREWQKTPPFDLMSLVEEGGCSAKLSAVSLREVMSSLKVSQHSRLLVGADTCDDAGVYLLNDEQALIETTDFFPPVCSDPYTFGQIAAANAMSDIYAMGGEVLTAMNIVLFPASGVPLDVLGEILRGGQEKVVEAGGLIVGGHTLTDATPKYGLAVTGLVHPSKLITNAGAQPGCALVLSKALGTGILQAARRMGIGNDTDYQSGLDSMRKLNRAGAKVMQEFGLRAATDVTGFGLLGHALHLARGSEVCLEIWANSVPVLSGVRELAVQGSIPGGAFRNEQYFREDLVVLGEQVGQWELLMILADPQTSGGLLMAVPEGAEEEVVTRLHDEGYEDAAAIGKVRQKGETRLRLIMDGK